MFTSSENTDHDSTSTHGGVDDFYSSTSTSPSYYLCFDLHDDMVYWFKTLIENKAINEYRKFKRAQKRRLYDAMVNTVIVFRRILRCNRRGLGLRIRGRITRRSR